MSIIGGMSALKRILPILLFIMLAACSGTTGLPAATDTVPPSVIPATDTPAIPTATPVPMAAMVNGEGITLAEFNAELARFKAAQTQLGKTVSDQDAASRVLNDLINQTLLAQGAAEAGYKADDASLQARIDKLISELGGADKLAAWQQAQGYTDESFRTALRRAVAAAWMRDKIISEVPATADQVHVRQILLYNESAAQAALEKLKSGSDFDELAAAYDPITRGDIGWFPRGYLLEPKVEEVAFALQPGQTSEIIASSIGWHIIKVLEFQANRPLAPAALLAVQNRALTDWVAKRTQQSKIVLAP